MTSLSYFVNKPFRLISSTMWLTEMVLFYTDSLVVFPKIDMWRRPFVVVDLLQHTHTLISLYTWMVLSKGMYIRLMHKSSKICLTRSKTLTRLSVA